MDQQRPSKSSSENFVLAHMEYPSRECLPLDWRVETLHEFKLVYAEIDQQLESKLAEPLRGVNSSTLAALSSKQLYEINELQCETLEEEDKLSQKMAALQQSMADRPLLSLAQVAFGSSSLEFALEGKVKKLQKLLVKANRLRFDKTHAGGYHSMTICSDFDHSCTVSPLFPQ